VNSLASYNERLKARIIRSLTSGPQTFREIIRSSGGAYPTIVLECLRELQSDLTKQRENLYSLGDSWAAASSQDPNSPLSSIEGNPVLCSWYFTDEACARLECLYSWELSRLVFLGAPRLYDWFCRHQIGRSRTLLELDRVVVRALSALADSTSESVILYDAREDLPSTLEGTADFVFLDPPWYPDCYSIWFRRAAQLAPCGTLFFPLFAEFTRPEASAQRTDLLASIGKAADTVFVLTDFVDYAVPSFEDAYLTSMELGGIGSWKVADLIVAKLRDSHAVNTVFPLPTPPDEISTWVEADIGNVRLFVDPKHSKRGAGLLSLPASGRLFRSPSRRDPENAELNVLSSRGHGLRTSDPKRLLKSLERIARETADGQSLNQVVRASVPEKEANSLLLRILCS
jgi:hypothetical protein